MLCRAQRCALWQRKHGSEIHAFVYPRLNICRHNTLVMHGAFSLLFVAGRMTTRVLSILFKYKDVYYFSLLYIYMFNLMDTKFFPLYVSVFNGVYGYV